MLCLPTISYHVSYYQLPYQGEVMTAEPKILLKFLAVVKSGQFLIVLN